MRRIKIWIGNKIKHITIIYGMKRKTTKENLNRHQYMSGSYTIEAAFIIPFILFVITALVYLGFYLHDQDKLESVINEALLSGKTLLRNEAQMETGLINYEAYNNRGILYSLQDNLQEKQEQVYNYLKSELRKGFMIAEISSIDVAVSHTKIDIQVEANMKLPFVGLLPFFSENGMTVIGKNSVTIEDNPEFIRIFSIYSSVAEKVPVINNNLEKLQEILSRFKN